MKTEKELIELEEMMDEIGNLLIEDEPGERGIENLADIPRQIGDRERPGLFIELKNGKKFKLTLEAAE